ncbi:SMI1/KNR4 family protein [Clostridium gasigenes]|uniref:SMI1/KNR4 family protein n=1 Tax=Clostridium gasigenes TaxID=94869 RepID=UPI001C0D8497|nr:SMI1/KNR4 family protein [Clostridium gasigenes]MBU3134609.1 SMI1/KNR4 family protein [Clostridium gasigenes]
MINEEIEFIKQYFQILSINHPEKLEIEEMFDDEGELIIPQNMKDNSNPEKWILMESNVSEADIFKLEKKFNIKLPSIYKAFISSYFHMFEELDGIFDDFYDEDDREVSVNIIPQPSDKSLLGIEGVFEECRELIDFGYIPIGDFNDCGPLCFDIVNNDKLIWLDHEDYYKCETREELEKIAIPIFNNFKEFMECFFCGITHKCGI